MTTDAITPDTAQQIVDRYFACWNTADTAERAGVVAQTWAVDTRSVDPVADVAGRDAIEAMFGAPQVQFPGHRFELTGAVRSHHDTIMWSWRMSQPDGATLMSGVDTATVDDGLITLLVGFFG